MKQSVNSETCVVDVDKVIKIILKKIKVGLQKCYQQNASKI